MTDTDEARVEPCMRSLYEKLPDPAIDLDSTARVLSCTITIWTRIALGLNRLGLVYFSRTCQC